MGDEELFEVFADEQQKAYAKEAMETYDPEIVRASIRRWSSYSDEKKRRIQEEGGRIYQDMASAMAHGPESVEVQALVERWRRNMENYWVPKPAQLLALAQNYNLDHRFKANFDAVHPDLASFMLQAVQFYVDSLED